MKTTLNLRFDKATIEAAKQYAAKEKMSVSEIVERYLKKLVSENKKKKYRSDELIGVFKTYKNFTDDEIRAIYHMGKHHA